MNPINPFVCLDCEKHVLNHSTKTIDCQDPVYKSSSVYSIPCPKQSGLFMPKNSFLSPSASSSDKRIEEILRLEKGIKQIEKGLFNREAYRKDQELIQRQKELLHEMTEEANKKKQKEEYSKAETKELLSRLGISPETTLNFSKAYNFVYGSFYNDKPIDEVAISYAADWNQNEISRRERLRKDAVRLDKSALDVKSFLDNKPIFPDMAVCYVYSMTDNFDEDGGYSYSGYAIVSVEVADILSHHYLVLVYDSQQDNNGYPGLGCGDPFNRPSGDCLSYNSICREIHQLHCSEDSRIVMRDKNSRSLEPIIKDFGVTDCWCLQCKETLRIYF